MKNPQRGEVWITDFGYAAKTRPALVLSVPALDEDRALTTMATRRRRRSQLARLVGYASAHQATSTMSRSPSFSRTSPAKVSSTRRPS